MILFVCLFVCLRRFVVLIELMLAAVKLAATYFAYTLKTGQESSLGGNGPQGAGTYQPYTPSTDDTA